MNPKSNQPDSNQNKTNRRSFIARTSASVAAFSIVPGYVLGTRGQTPPSGKLNLAAVGVGGMGRNNLAKLADENIVALCDVDAGERATKIIKLYPKAKVYRDYREMFEKQKDIDAVIIATPDHTHGVIGMAAIKAGKHIYMQKPLAHSIFETRKLTEAAREKKLVTQMGNQGHSGDGVRQMCEWIWSGAIGDVREVHAWTNRPVWPQGVEVERPKETPPVPNDLDWDLWIGPAAMRPYHPTYAPSKWRAWWDFGTGSLGDLGCHVLDPVFWALKLGHPTSVEGCISTYWHEFWQLTEPKNETYPRSTIVRYKFPARGNMAATTLTWWDGGLLPPRPEELEEGKRMGDADGGVLFMGDKGVLMCGCYGMNPQLLPGKRMKEFQQPAPTIERIPGGSDGHEKDWARACKGGKPASSNWEYSGPMTEVVLLGNLAVRNPNQRLLWDGPNLKITNDADADAYIRRNFRAGWSL